MPVEPEDDEQTGPKIAAASPAGLAHISSGGVWIPFEHLLIIDEHLMKVASGEINRLLVELPVRHGKSMLISQYLPVWWLGRRPNDQIMLASYEATFARSWGRKARDLMKEFGPRVFGVTVAEMPAAADEWCIQDHAGVMVTAGVGGGITGKGANLLIIDDPVKNAEEANSEVFRQKTWDWWQSTARPRLQPGGSVIVTMARWHEDDLAGRIAANQDEDERWTILRLPALAEEEKDPLGRQPGDALCPELYDEKVLNSVRRQSAYWFNALYQQRPAPAEGLLFKRKDFRYWTAAGEGDTLVYRLLDGDTPRTFAASECTKFQTADVAGSEKTKADWTVVSTWAVTPNKDLLLLASARQKFETLKVADFLKAQNEEHGRPPMWIETFGAGKVPHKQLSQKGYPVREFTAETGSRTDKVQRAMVAVAIYERHQVFHPEGFKEGDFEHEMVSFPSGAHDDQVDTVSYAGWLLPTISVIHEIRQPPKGKTTMGNVRGRNW